MEHDIPFGHSNRENRPTFLDFPLFLGIFQWDEPTKCVPFTAEPEIPEILTKWKAPKVLDQETKNVFTTCKAVIFRGGQRIIAVHLTSRGNKSTIKKIISCLFVFLAYCICPLVLRLQNASDTHCNRVNS